ncbi:MAG: type IV pilus assembly protein PilE [Pseudohongiellaceae bacterium]|jgi:type IV pilus assembly protein PilE
MKFMAEKHSGFSLIELMIVVVIIGILGSVAVPSYNAYIENGKRAEGKAFALDIASRQERHFTQYSRYASSLTAADASGLNMGSASSENGTYSAVATVANGNTTYLITLTPAIIDSTCGALTLTNTGDRGAGGSVSDCWR